MTDVNIALGNMNMILGKPERNEKLKERMTKTMKWLLVLVFIGW